LIALISKDDWDLGGNNGAGRSDSLCIVGNPGYLQIPTNNTAVIKILDWIAKGGGTWAAIVKKSFSKYGKKSTILSAQNIVYNEVTQDSDLRSEEDVKPVLQKMRPKYAVGNGGDEGNSE